MKFLIDRTKPSTYLGALSELTAYPSWAKSTLRVVKVENEGTSVTVHRQGLFFWTETALGRFEWQYAKLALDYAVHVCGGNPKLVPEG